MSYKVFRFSEHLRGKEDHEVINYAFQKQYGLITHDKECVKKAYKRFIKNCKQLGMHK